MQGWGCLGNTPPWEGAKHWLLESRDCAKAKDSTFHALSKCLGEAGLKFSWDSGCGRGTVLNGVHGQLCVQRERKQCPTPALLGSWASFHSQIQALKSSKPRSVFCGALVALPPLCSRAVPQPCPALAQREEVSPSRLLPEASALPQLCRRCR